MTNKTIAAIIAITIIVGICAWRNIDGALIGAACTIIGGLGGYAYRARKK